MSEIKLKKHRINDLKGRRYGLWTVLGFAGTNKHNKATWQCRCECGAERAVCAGDLKLGKSKGCGCFAVTTRAPGEASKRQIYTTYKHNAKNRGYCWELTEDQFRDLIEKPCHYCGVVNSNTRYGTRLNGPAEYNGIDRVNNTQGYFLSNCVPCCKLCNRAKRDHDVTFFESWILTAADFIRARQPCDKNE